MGRRTAQRREPMAQKGRRHKPHQDVTSSEDPLRKLQMWVNVQEDKARWTPTSGLDGHICGDEG